MATFPGTVIGALDVAQTCIPELREARMVLAASGGVKAVLALHSGCRITANYTTARVAGRYARPAAAGHDYCARGAAVVFVAEGDGEIGA